MIHPLLLGCLGLLVTSTASANNRLSVWPKPELEPLRTFFTQQTIPQKDWPCLEYIDHARLPKPYDSLLEQPLLTIAISHYFQRTPKIRPPLYIVRNTQEKTYSRAIVMIIDKNKNRDDAFLADKIGESQITELGLITINFAALPSAVIEGVLEGQIPFGALLTKNSIKVHDADTHYFKIQCDATLSKYLQCTKDEILYGRINSLINDTDGRWIAKVVTILPMLKISNEED